MDAGIVLTTPQAPPPSAADASPDSAREDAEAFAAHLPQETQTKPAPRKPVASEKEDLPEEVETTTAAPSFSLTAPTAPVLVRENGALAVLDIALTPSVAPRQAAPDAGAAIAPPSAQIACPPSKEPALQTPTPATPPAAPAQAALPEKVAAPATPPTAAIADAGPQLNLAAAQTLVANGSAPTRPTPASESLRGAGRPRGAKAEAQANGEARPVRATAAAATSGARLDAKPEFIAASASAPVAQSSGDDAAAQPTSTGEAAAVSLEARRAAEAPPVAVHRPPTIAATVAQHVIRRFDGKSTSIDVRLDPAELGRVSVKLEVGPDSRVTAVVAADNPATLSDLMRSARELERALESAGLELTQGGLTFDLSDRSSRDSAQAQESASASIRAGNDNTAVSTDAAAPASRPFGLESWRGVRVDVTV